MHLYRSVRDRKRCPRRSGVHAHGHAGIPGAITHRNIHRSIRAHVNVAVNAAEANVKLLGESDFNAVSNATETHFAAGDKAKAASYATKAVAAAKMPYQISSLLRSPVVKDNKDLLAGVLKAADQVATRAGQEFAGGQHQPRVTISKDARTRIARAVPARHHQRRADDPGIKAAEECDEALDPHREYQQRACSGGGTLGEPAGQCGGAAIEFGKGYRGVLVAAIGQRDIGAVVRLYRRAVAEQGGQRGQGGNNGEVAVSRRRHPPPRLGDWR